MILQRFRRICWPWCRHSGAVANTHPRPLQTRTASDRAAWECIRSGREEGRAPGTPRTLHLICSRFCTIFYPRNGLIAASSPSMTLTTICQSGIPLDQCFASSGATVERWPCNGGGQLISRLISSSKSASYNLLLAPTARSR